jgi:rubrerythrin
MPALKIEIVRLEAKMNTKSTVEVRDWSLATEEEILRGYEEMASDSEPEAEALEWSEALIGDGFEAR